MENELKVTIIPNEHGEIVFREGAALPAMPPNQVNIQGTITGPGIWASAKLTPESAKECTALIDQDQGKISLITHEHSEYPDIVIGMIELDPQLEKFKINTGQRYTAKQLSDLLRFNRIFFVDKDRNMALVTELQSLKGVVETKFESRDDMKGSRAEIFVQDLMKKYDLSFMLKIPIFKYEAPIQFFVDVNYDVSEGSVRFWLESVELAELLYSKTQDILLHEITILKNAGVTVIYV